MSLRKQWADGLDELKMIQPCLERTFGFKLILMDKTVDETQAALDQIAGVVAFNNRKQGVEVGNADRLRFVVADRIGRLHQLETFDSLRHRLDCHRSGPGKMQNRADAIKDVRLRFRRVVLGVDVILIVDCQLRRDFFNALDF